MDDHITDQDFFEKEIVPYYTNIIKFLIYSSQDNDLAYDITQDTMEVAWKYIKKLRTYDNIEAGLITIAKNKLKKHCRKHPASIPIEELEHVESPDKSLDEIVVTIDTGMEMRELFRTLDKNHARIVLLHHYHKLPLKEIAEMYGYNYNTVLSWHNRAIKKLQENCMKNEDF